MSGLIHKSKEEEKKEKLPPIMLFIEGIRYNNAAAKFWASLIDEVMEEYPSCDSVEILASTSEQLNRKHLFPEKVFSEQIRYFLARNTRVLMKELLAEMEVLGPPASVEIRLLSGEKFLYSGELPLDCVDAEILPFLRVAHGMGRDRQFKMERGTSRGIIYGRR